MIVVTKDEMLPTQAKDYVKGTQIIREIAPE